MAVQYINLRKQGETIINKATGESYADPTQLAVDLGIKADDIEWGRIAEETVGTPTATGSIKPRDFEPEKPIEAVNKPIDETNYGAITEGALPPPPTELDIEEQNAETEASTLGQSITDLLAESQTEGAYTQEQLQEAGVPQYEKDIQDLTNQMRSLEMESQANQIRIADQTKTTGHISGELTKNERDTAIRTLTLSAQLQAKQGNLTLALKQAQREVDLKYKPIADKLAIVREQYELNKDALERIDKKQASALAERIRKEEADLEVKKQRDSDLNSIALKAAEGGAPSSVINAIKNSVTAMDAIGLASGFLDTDLQLALQRQAASQADVDRKFAEDVRQFDVQTAIRNKELGISAMNAQTSRMNATKNDVVPGDNQQLYAGLTSPTATAVRSKVSKFSSEPVVTNFNVINEGYNFAMSIPNNTKNPADNQGMIYAFAKIMDPNSVVREGEYSTVQKYSQTWLESFGFNAARVVNNQEFLTPEAIQNMKSTIARKFSASKTNYDNVYSQYASGINNLTGRDDGNKFLVDYSQAFSGRAQTTNDDDYEYTLKTNAGSDGYVSPQDWDSLRESYVSNGGSASDFESKYGKFKNPNNKNY